MNIALGYAVNPSELFIYFDPKKLGLSRVDCRKILSSNSRKDGAAIIFNKIWKIFIEDMVENDSKIIFDVRKNWEMSVEINMSTPEEFKYYRKNSNKWEDIDFLQSNFQGYYIIFKLINKKTKTFFSLPCYVDNKLKKRIIEKINSGFKYCGRNDKSYKNYYTELLKINPEINIKDLNYIVRYGYGYMFKFLVKGCDIIFKRDKFFFKIGYLQKDPLKAYQYYKRKLYKKILFGEFLKWKKTSKFVDKYFYCTFSEEQHFNLLKGNTNFLENYTINKVKALAILTDVNSKVCYLYKIHSDNLSWIKENKIKFKHILNIKNISLIFVEKIENGFNKFNKIKNIENNGFMSK